MRLSGKVAIVTGGARNIGEAIARLFAKEDAKVVIGDLLEAEGKKVEKDINGSGGVAVFVKMDVASESDWIHVVELARSRFGRLDILVNNAAIVEAKLKIEDTPEALWDKVMAVNARGVFLGTKQAISAMRHSGGGSIVNISSQLGIVGSDFENVAYQASKGAIRIFTKTTALQYAKDNIRANSVHPGPIETWAGSRDPERLALVLSKVPMGRRGRPEEVANGVLFLASDESSYITGAELLIDGGWTAQ